MKDILTNEGGSFKRDYTSYCLEVLLQLLGLLPLHILLQHGRHLVSEILGLLEA